MDDLASLKTLLQRGLAASMQGSYDRRLPEKEALPSLRSARKGLRELAKAEPSADVLRSLALAEEALLNYPAAVAALEAAVKQSERPDRKDLKRLAALREYAARWTALGITPQALAALETFLEKRLDSTPCDHSLRHTDAWLTSREFKARLKILRVFEQLGGHCDCEVLMNVV